MAWPTLLEHRREFEAWQRTQRMQMNDYAAMEAMFRSMGSAGESLRLTMMNKSSVLRQVNREVPRFIEGPEASSAMERAMRYQEPRTYLLGRDFHLPNYELYPLNRVAYAFERCICNLILQLKQGSLDPVTH